MSATEPLNDTFGYGLLAGRPSAGIAGRVYYATDTSTLLYRDNGSTWDTIALGGAAATDLDVSPNPTSDDQEFKSSLSGWTTLGSLDTSDANASGYESYLRLVKTATGTFQVHGIYRSAPSVPFTLTCRMPDYLNTSNFQQHGLLLTEASPGKLFLWGPTYQSANGTPEMLAGNWTNRTTRSTITEYAGTRVLVPKYLRLIVNSNTSVDLHYSHDGKVWIVQATAWNPNMTIANFGFAMTGHDNSVACSVVVDWLRFGSNVIRSDAIQWQRLL